MTKTFPRFSPTCFARIKARKIMIYKKNPAEISRSNVFFTLHLFAVAS